VARSYTLNAHCSLANGGKSSVTQVQEPLATYWANEYDWRSGHVPLGSMIYKMPQRAWLIVNVGQSKPGFAYG
jgi:hypothetical protein